MAGGAVRCRGNACVARVSGDADVPAGLPGASPLTPGTKALAAVSGGPDSTAMLLWLVESGAEVTAAHFDHALRPESPKEAEHVARLCAGKNVPLILGRRDRPLPRGSLQAAARSLRHDFLEEAQRQAGSDVICLGHTSDDVVEGVVMHLLRGSGLAGLRGIPQRRGPFIRPLLNVWRTDIESYLAERDIEPLRDPSNRDSARFARARVRHLLLPALERDHPGLIRRLRTAAEKAAIFQDQLEERARCLLRDGTALRDELRASPRAERMEVYRQLYGLMPALNRRHLEAMDAIALHGATGSGLDLPGGLRFRALPDRVCVGTATMPAPAPPTLSVRPCLGCREHGAVHLRPGHVLTVGYRRPGLRMRPLGAPGSRKLQDVLTDAKVPRHERDQLPLVFADGRLAWVPGVAVDTDFAARSGGDSVHITLDRSSESPVVLSSSIHPRSPVI